ncbi:MAG TPA: SPOR domain-containing protein [Candidatus Cloacimonetes bacterium]|nr:SPOR domain-containing protein [Candidatus Cloacimonadota bacterium]
MKTYLFLLLFFIGFSLFADENPEEIFLQAKSKIKEKDFMNTFEYLAENYTDHFYGQLSLLELAKVELLERNYENALSFLKRIHHSEIVDKEFWMAKAYLKNNENDNAIIAAQNFIFGSDDFNMIEEAYFIIAEAYLNDKIFQRALNTLESLRTSKYIKNHIPLLHYKLGFCYEQMGQYENALRSYKKLKMDFPYDQYSYLAEDKINNLTRKNKIEIDLKNIEPINSKVKQEKNTETNSIELKTYLQAGAFSLEKNARNHSVTINELGLPAKIFSKVKNGKTLYIVAAGPFAGKKELQTAKKMLTENNITSFEIKR